MQQIADQWSISATHQSSLLTYPDLTVLNPDPEGQSLFRDGRLGKRESG